MKTVDVDMELPITLPQIVFSAVQRGKAIYAPIVRTLDQKGGFKYFDWGYGMIGSYVEDYIQIHGYNTFKFKYGW